MTNMPLTPDMMFLIGQGKDQCQHRIRGKLFLPFMTYNADSLLCISAPLSYPTPTSWPGHASGPQRSFDPPFGADSSRSYRAPYSPYHSSHDGSSVDGASPVSPTTPRSTEVPPFKSGHVDYGDKRKHVMSYQTPPPDAQKYNRKLAGGLSAGVDPRLSACRHSCDDDEAESDSSMRGPMRPW